MMDWHRRFGENLQPTS